MAKIFRVRFPTLNGRSGVRASCNSVFVSTYNAVRCAWDFQGLCLIFYSKVLTCAEFRAFLCGCTKLCLQTGPTRFLTSLQFLLRSQPYISGGFLLLQVLSRQHSAHGEQG